MSKLTADEWEERDVVRRLFLPELSQYSAGMQLQLSTEEQHYALNVLRVVAGQQVELFDGCGHMAQAEVLVSRKRELLLGLGTVATSDEIPGPTLAVGYCKRFDQVLEKATELGARAIIPLLTERTAIPWQSGKVEHFQKIILAAGRQSGRYYFPQLLSPLTLSQLFAGYSHIAAALPHGPAMHCLPRVPDCLLIGPEGGFSPAEISQFKEMKLAAYGLAPFILRVETAALASLAAYWQCQEG